MFTLWDMVRPDGPDPLYFFAEHARGLQKEWVEYFNIVFKEPLPVPSCGPAQIRAYIDPQDKDTPTCAYPLTRFHFGSDTPNDDLPAIVTKLRDHVICDTMLVAIFEDKFDEQLILNLSPDTFQEFLDKRVLDRLVKSMSFVKDVERAIDLISKVKGCRYDPDVVHFSVTINTDETTEKWREQLSDWEVNETLAKALREIATAGGRPNWNLADIDIEKESWEEVFHITVFFFLNRICVGIELYEDDEIHPFLATTTQSFSGGLCSYIAHAINPKPHDIVLEVNFVMGDIAMSVLYQFDCMYYAGVPQSDLADGLYRQVETETPLHMWSQLKPAVIARDGKFGQREFQMFTYSDFRQFFEFDMLEFANRLFSYVDFDLFDSNEDHVDDFYRGVIELFGRTAMDTRYTLVIPLNHLDSLIQLTNDRTKGVLYCGCINLVTFGRWVSVVQLRRYDYSEMEALQYFPRDDFEDDNDDDSDGYDPYAVPCLD